MIDAKKYLDNFYKGNRNLSLDAMKYFMDEYKDLQKEIKFIHIAGTNGKGSCIEMISNILVCQGYKVGKTISPHLINYNERIVINGKTISDVELSELIEELEPKIEKYNKISNHKITLFELETMMEMLYFYKNKVDFVVIETGLGGRYDSTNIIAHPVVSIITSIGHDHMHILGETLPEIATHKAGIIKENSNTIIYKQEDEVNKIFIEECKMKKNKLSIINPQEIKNYRYDENYQYFDYKDLKNIEINLKGIKQVQNACICIECMKILNRLGYKVSEASIRKGLKTVIHKARMEVLSNKPFIIFDGAHNEPAIRNLQESVKMYYKNKKRRYIISILKRKDYETMVRLMLEDEDAIFVLTSGNDKKRFASSQELYDITIKYAKGQTIVQKDFDDAIDEIQNNGGYINFIIGSFYVYGTVTDKLNKKNRK